MRTLILFSVAMLLAIAGAACGGDGGGEAGPTLGPPLSLEEYFDEVAKLDSAFGQRSTELDAQLAQERATITSSDEAVDVARRYMGDSVFSIEQFVDGLAALSPPPEAEAIHAQVIQRGEGTMDAFNKLPDQFGELTSGEDLATLLADSELEEASAALRQTCVDLQAVAERSGIDVELSCRNYVPERG